MEINHVRIYKYQYLIDMAERVIHHADDTYPKHLLCVPFLNPHENYVLTNPVSADSPFFSSYKYGLSKHPHDKAVEMLKKNLQLVDLNALIENPNPKIAPLLEQMLDQFQFFHWSVICESNHQVILEFLERHTDKIEQSDWLYLSENPHEIAIRILQNNPSNINFERLSGNPSGMEILKQNMDKIDWGYFSKNSHPDAIRIIEQNLDKINWKYFAMNTHPDAIRIIEHNLHRVSLDIYWMEDPNYMYQVHLSQNSSAFNLLIKIPHLIRFKSALCNRSDIAMAYIEANSTRINDSNIRNLVQNPNGLSLIEKLLKHGHIREEAVLNYYSELVMNESFFDVDLDLLEMIKARSKIIYSELLEKALHPSRVSKWLDHHCENGGTPDDFEM